MRRRYSLLSLPILMMGTLLAGCGGGGVTASAPPTSEPAPVEDGTAQFTVDVASGKVKVLPLQTGKGKSAVLGGSTLSFTSSDVFVEGGEQGRRSIKVSMRNNLKETIGVGRAIRVQFGTVTPQVNYDEDVTDQTRVTTTWNAGFGSDDGPVSSASAGSFRGVAIGADGAAYLATNDNRIRKVYNGYVSTVAINCRMDGMVYLKDPSSGREYLVGASADDHCIRSVNAATGTVVTFAGAVGVTGNINGAAAAARFNSPANMAVEPNYGASGNLLIADSANNAVRGLAFSFSGGNLVAGQVSTRYAAIGNPYGLAVLPDKTVAVCDFLGNRVRIFNLGGSRETTIGTGVAGNATGAGNIAAFNSPYGMTAVGNSFIIVDSTNRRLKKIQARPGAAPLVGSNWQVSNFAYSGAIGNSDGPGSTATTDSAFFLATAPDGSIFQIDTGRRLRRIESEAPAFDLGSPQGTGNGAAKLTNATGFNTLDGNRRPYIDYNLTIAPGQTVDLGQWDFQVPSTLPAFTFSVTVETATSVFNGLDAVLSDGFSGGSDRVGFTELNAGSGFELGPLATSKLGQCLGAGFDREGNLFLSDIGNNCILRVDRQGIIRVIAGRPVGGGIAADGTGATANFSLPTGILVDPDGKGLYVSDFGSSTIRFVELRKDVGGAYLSPNDAANWQVTTVVGTINTSGNTEGIGNAARLFAPLGICGTYGSTMYVVQRGNSIISRIRFNGSGPSNPSNYALQTIAGSTAGFADGSPGRFNGPAGICVGPDDNLYIADSFNSRIRRISKAGGFVSTVAGDGSVGTSSDNPNALNAVTPNVYSIVADQAGAIYFSSQRFGENARLRRLLDGGVMTVAAGSNAYSRTGVDRASTFELLVAGPNGELVSSDNGRLFRASRILGNR